MQFRVTFDILTESRTDTFLGSSRSDLQNLTAVVEEIIADRLDDAAGDVCDQLGLFGPIYEG